MQSIYERSGVSSPALVAVTLTDLASREEAEPRMDDHITTDARTCSSCGAPIDPRDMKGQPATALEYVPDEYPIRQSWTFAVSPESATQVTASRES